MARRERPRARPTVEIDWEHADLVQSATTAANVRSTLLTDRDLILDTCDRLDLAESDLPGWANSVFAPDDCQWGFTVRTRF